MKTNIRFSSHLVQFLEWEMFQTKVVEKKHTFRVPFFFENRAFYEISVKIL